MPVPYIPQFVPTNTQALQGTLNEYQKAYDENLARELQVQDQYSIIPTIGAGDTSIKNKILNDFSNKLSELEKKHNFDRASSSYTKELAKEISNIRKDPFWTYNERKKELISKAEEDRRRLGSFYFSEHDPMSAHYTNQTALNEYTPLDTRDLIQMVGAAAKEHATSMVKPINKSVAVFNPATGQTEYFAELGEQYGFKDAGASEQWLQKEGQEYLNNWMRGTAFEKYMDNPIIREAAMNAARQNLVGEYRTSFQRMQMPEIDARGQKDPEGRFTEISNTEINQPYAVQDLKSFNKRFDEESTSGELSDDIIVTKAVVDSIKSSEQSQQVLNRGIEVLSKNLTSIVPTITPEETQQIFDKIEKYYNNTTPNRRAVAFSRNLNRFIKEVVKDKSRIESSGTLYDAEKYIHNDFKLRYPGLVFNVDRASEQYVPVFSAIKDPVLRTQAKQEWYNLGNIKSSNDIIKYEINKWYNDPNFGYYTNIEKPINDILSKGRSTVSSISVPSVNTPKADIGALVENITSNRTWMVPIQDEFKNKGKKESGLWNDDAVTDFLTKAGTSPEGVPNISMAIQSSSEGLPIIKLVSGVPSGKGTPESMDLTFDPTRATKEGIRWWIEFATKVGKPELIQDALLQDLHRAATNKGKIANLINLEVFSTRPVEERDTTPVTEKDLENFKWSFKVRDGQEFYTLQVKVNDKWMPYKSEGKDVEIYGKKNLLAELTRLLGK